MTGDSTPISQEPAGIDANVAHASRVYDYLLGGVTNFEVDRAAANHLADALGGFDIAEAHVRANRWFLVQAVEHLADAGIRQFLDIGTGVPNDTNTHVVAQRRAPEARVVCVDNDPIVLAHAHQLFRSTPEGSAAFIDGDIRKPRAILAEAAGTLDFNQPVAVMLVAIVHAVGDHDNRKDLVTTLVDAAPPGSYLAMTHLASDINPAETAEATRRLNQASRETYVAASTDEFARYFDGLDLVGPGITRVDQWGTQEADASAIVAPFHAAVARKPSPVL